MILIEGFAILVLILSRQGHAIRMTAVVNLAHRSLIGFGVCKLDRYEGDYNQAHDHLLDIDKNLLFELYDVVLAVH